MKKIHLFATKPWYFLVTLPPIFVFVLCVIYHPRAGGDLGLLPLEFIMVGVVIFSVFFFWRTVRISYEEVRLTGIFSGHDRMDLTLGRELIVVLRPHGNLGVYVYGEDRAEEEFWLLNEKPKEHILMRARAVGTKGSLKKILAFFQVEEEYLDELCTKADITREFEYVDVTTLIEEEKFVVRIKLKREFDIEED